jgi:hypothetical protein
MPYYIGTVRLYNKGKSYGSTTRRVSAPNKKMARLKLKQMFKYGNNKVTVPKLLDQKEMAIEVARRRT